MAARGKIYWVGNHKNRALNGRALGPPLGKLPAEGIKLLESHGWARVERDTDATPVFAFTTRKGGDFPAIGPGFPRVRQLPQNCTASLDDKRSLWKNMERAGFGQSLPITLGHDAVSGVVSDMGAAPGAPLVDSTGASGIWFLKHAWGVKGNAVHVHFGLVSATESLQRMSPKSRELFIVQKEVAPMLIGGRKFVIRSHVLVTLQRQRFESFLHDDSIVLEHSDRYDPESDKKAVHVSQYAKRPPEPYLLKGHLGDEISPQLHEIVRQTMVATRSELIPEITDPYARFYHLFGYDFMVDVNGAVVLLEVNAYPALGNGSMRFVPKEIFNRLVVDVIHRVVLPVVDDAEIPTDGFNLVFEQG